MSNLATARPLRRPAPERARPHIEIVPDRRQRRARPKVAYGVITILSVLAIYGAQLMLSIVVADGAYQLEGLQSQRTELQRQEQALREELAIASSQQNLANQAAALGMVPNATQLSLDLSTGAVAQLPGVAGCGGCNSVPNSLVAGVPLVTQAPASGQIAAGDAAQAPPPAPAGTVDALPAPVTR